MSKKWTKWIHNGDPDVFPYKKEVVQVQTLPDGSIRYKRLKKNVEAENIVPSDDWDAGFEDILIKDPIDVCMRTIDSLYELVPPEEVALELDKLKAVLRRHLNTAENKASDPEQTVSGATPSEQPEAIITGPGEYKTRSGVKATVRRASTSEPGTFGGDVFNGQETVPGDGYFYQWDESGRLNPGFQCPYDITGPWVEDEPEPKPEKAERWVNLYRTPAGGLSLTTYEYGSLQEALDNTFLPEVHIGTVLLSHTVEEG